MRLYNALTLLAAVALAPGSANAQWDDFSRWHVMPMQIDRENRSDSFLGVLLEDVDPNRVEELNLPAERGALVARVIEESPAAGAGIEADDVITRWNDATVEGARALQRLVGETPVGRAVDVSLIRGGEQKQVEVLVGTRDDFGGQRTAWHPPIDQPWDAPGDDWSEGLAPPQGPSLGVMVQPLTDQLGAYFGLVEDQPGVLIAEVLEGTPAEQGGIQAGDVLTAVAGEMVGSAREVRDALVGKSGTIGVELIRDRNAMGLDVDLGNDDDAEKDGDEAAAEDDEEEDESPVLYPRSAM